MRFNNSLPALVALCFLSSFAAEAFESFETVPPPSLKATVKEVAAYAQTQVSRYQADLELARKNALAKPDEAYACRAIKIKFKRDYYQWFIDHQSEFARIETLGHELIRETERKLRNLDTATFEPLPAQNANRRPDPVSLQSLFRYVKIYNSLKGARANSSSTFQKMLDDPELNPTGMSLQQLKDTLEGMVNLLNASLRETDVIWSLELDQHGDSFDVMLLINSKDSAFPGIRYSLSTPSGTPRQLTLETVWKAYAYTPGFNTIASQPILGWSRLYDISRQALTGDCDFAGWNDVDSTKLNMPTTLLTSFESLDAAIKERREVELVVGRRMQAENQKRYAPLVAAIRAQTRPSNGIIYRGKAYDFVTDYYLQFRDLQTGETQNLGFAVNEDAVVANDGRNVYVFAVGSNESLFYATFASILAQNADWKLYAQNVGGLSVTVVNGRITLKYKDLRTGTPIKRTFAP